MSSVAIRELLETELGCSLELYKRYIDAIVFQFYNQLVECATPLLGYLYLGTEWNASDYDNLVKNNVTHIINVSYEVDNFFTDSNLKYLNIRVFDNDTADLLKEFDRTFKFINEAREQNTSCLVHCKMGVSRSATICVAYFMKEKSLGLSEALRQVKHKRPCVNPNSNFMQQLNTYESILNAHRSKYNLFEPLSIEVPASSTKETNLFDENELVVGAVKDAINKIQMKSNNSDLTLISPLNINITQPFSSASSSSSSASTSPIFVESADQQQQQQQGIITHNNIRRCQSMKIRESPKPIKRTPSYLNASESSSNVKKIAEDLMSSTNNLENNMAAVHQSMSSTSLNELSSSVPVGLVKRQVESINIKSRPCTPESGDEASSSALNNELTISSNNELLKLQLSPDSKRCRIDDENVSAAAAASSIVRTTSSNSNRSSKKVFEFLADKLKENNEEIDVNSSDNDFNKLVPTAAVAPVVATSNDTRRKDVSKSHALSILENYKEK